MISFAGDHNQINVEAYNLFREKSADCNYSGN